MSVTYDAGIATSYAAAVAGGYTGTKEQYYAEQAQFAVNAQRVAQDRTAVEQAVSGFTGTTVPGAIQSVTSEGNTQVQRVKEAGDEYLEDIDTRIDDAVADLKEDLTEFTGNKNYTYTKNKSINYTNPLVQNTENGWESVIVPCVEGDVFYIKGFGGNNTRLWAFSDSNGSTISVSNAGARATEYVELIAPAGAAHLSCNNWYSQSYEGRLVYGTNLRNKIGELETEIKDFENNLHLERINLFDPNTITEGKYIANDGTLWPNSDFFASDFIDVSGYDSITLSYTHIAHWYDSSKTNISAVDGMNTVDNADATVTVPSTAKYIRFSTYNTYLNTAQVGKNISRNNYFAYSYYRLPYLVLENDGENRIIVDANGGGDYTSFTEAVYENVDNGKTIVVKAGTYDIVAEYVAKFGQSVVDSLADSTSGLNNFQYGIRIHDRKVTFESGAHFVCDWTGHTVDGTHRFCALRVEPNAELIGLDLDCTATFYGIHDDYGTADNSPFTIKYENCRVIGHNLYNANCIGGGAHKYSRHILKNCYFKNNVNSNDIVLSADVRYHNTNTENAEPELYVSNCYFSNNMNVTYYGNQTTKMRAYVNNCFAPRGINKRAESSTMAIDNVELYMWNNQTD